jgi:hypothetical protein
LRRRKNNSLDSFKVALSMQYKLYKKKEWIKIENIKFRGIKVQTKLIEGLKIKVDMFFGT